MAHPEQPGGKADGNSGGKPGGKTGGKADGQNGASQSIDELKQRYDQLHQRKIRAEANRDNAENRLAELKAEAKKRYGTDDVDELKTMLAEMKAENEKKRAEYQKQLDKIETELTEVESQFNDADLDSADGSGSPSGGGNG